MNIRLLLKGDWGSASIDFPYDLLNYADVVEAIQYLKVQSYTSWLMGSPDLIEEGGDAHYPHTDQNPVTSIELLTFLGDHFETEEDQ